MSQASSKDIQLGLAKAIRDAVAQHEAAIAEAKAREARGRAKMRKNDAGIDKCGDVEVKKDELTDLQPVEAAGCPACSGTNCHHLGDLAARAHFLCGDCGMSYSHPREENAMAHTDDPMVKAEGAFPIDGQHVATDEVYYDRKTGKKIPAPTPESAKDIKVVDTEEGSGGAVTKGKGLKKDALPASRPRLPGMTPSKTGPAHPEVQASLKDIAGLKGAPVVKPQLPAAPKTRPAGGFAKKPAADDVPGFISNPQTTVDEKAQLAADKKAGGVGFLQGLVAKFRGAGNATWNDHGAGAPSAARATRAMGTRMAMGEKPMDKCGDVKAGKPMEKAWRAGGPRPKSGSVAEPPKPEAEKPVKKAALGTGKPAMPSAPKPPAAAGAKPPMGKSDDGGTELVGLDGKRSKFTSIASNPTALPRLPGLKNGPAKPKAAPPSAKPPTEKAEKPADKDVDKALATSNHNRSLI